MPGEPDPRYVLARRVLLDALMALKDHRANIVIIGAQAIYHWAGEADLRVAPFTSDADLAVDPRGLRDEPRLDRALVTAGFVRGTNPGAWLAPHDVPVDLLVPQALAPREGRRAARIPPHPDGVARKADGIEGCVVDTGSGRIGALEPGDDRTIEVRVAGPAAMMVAKLIKLDERAGAPPHRMVPKDALDIHRLLVALSTDELARRFATLMDSEISRPVAVRAVEIIGRLFPGAEALGPSLVARAIGPAGEPEAERRRSVVLARELTARLREIP